MRRLLLTLTLAAALVGCGGDDKLSAGDYRAELKKICEETERKSNAVRQPTRATPEAIVDYLERLRDVNAESIEEVSDLEPPDELKDAHDRALAANREGREKVDEVIDDLEGGGDPTEVLSKARKGLEESSEAAQKAGRDLGVPECGGG
jgi:hypothetical protein